MLKRIKWIMNIAIGTTIGVYIGNVIFTWTDYMRNPGIYEMQSAPWYLRIVVLSVFCGIALAVEIAVLCFVRCKIKKDQRSA